MIERFLEIPTADGRMETFVTHPQQDGPFPPVILYMDVWGVREELYDLARRVATVGYYCMVPDFYYRQGKIRSTFINDKGERISLNRLSKEDQDKVLAPAHKLADAMVVADSGAILTFLQNGGEPAIPDAVGSIGYCMGGRHVMQVAVQYPDRFKASASLHGTTLISDRPDSPHLGVAKLRGELYCGFAEHDRLRAAADGPATRRSAEAMSGQVQPRDPQGRRARLCASRPRYLRQEGGGARLGAHIRDVPSPNSALSALVSRFRRLYPFAARPFTSVGTKGTLATL